MFVLGVSHRKVTIFGDGHHSTAILAGAVEDMGRENAGGRINTLGKDDHGATRKHPPKEIEEAWHALDRQAKEAGMKLRLKGNSIRLRLDRRDLERLIHEGRLDDAVRFGPGLAFMYAVEAGPSPHGRQKADYAADASGSGSIPMMPRTGSPATAWASTACGTLKGASFACSWRKTSPASTDRPEKRRTTPTPSPTRRPFASVSRSALLTPRREDRSA